MIYEYLLATVNDFFISQSIVKFSASLVKGLAGYILNGAS
jgi:hypothetical protein